MRYQRGHKSKNVEYRASSGGRGGLPGGLAGGIGVGGGLIGIVMAVLFAVLGGGGGGGGFNLPSGLNELDAASTGGSAGSIPPQNDFLEFVFDDIQTTWQGIFQASGQQYEDSTLIVFDRSVTTGGCGSATSAVGPFYCPADSLVYIDQAFYDELAGRFGAPGDFAQAYVIAHEIGHHLQNLLGISDQVRRQQQSNPNDANDLSIRLELQADCFAGVWGHEAQTRGILEAGDLQEGLGAAAAVGDDNIQREMTGSINRETWTHGSSEQRTHWFEVGFNGGDPSACDTFSGDA